MSQQRGETGIVVLHVVIDADGRVQAARVETSSGYARLDDAARATVLDRWRCQPGIREGSLEITFKLE